MNAQSLQNLFGSSSSTSSPSEKQLQLLIDVYKSLKKDQILMEYIKNDPDSHLSQKASDKLIVRMKEHRDFSVLTSVLDGNSNLMPLILSQIPKFFSTIAEIRDYRSNLENELKIPFTIPDETSEIGSQISKLVMNQMFSASCPSELRSTPESTSTSQSKSELSSTPESSSTISKSKKKRNKRKNKKAQQKFCQKLNSVLDDSTDVSDIQPFPDEDEKQSSTQSSSTPPMSAISELISNSMSLFSQFQDGKRPRPKSLNKTVKQARNLISDMLPGVNLDSIFNLASNFGSEFGPDKTPSDKHQ